MTETREEKRIALLIDGENISSKYVEVILSETAKHGVITYKRIYGNWSVFIDKKWEEKIKINSITPMMQINNSIGKNATDSALIIDAMDILYSGNVDGFCIISSDGDFTRLAARLRESGMLVIGMGEDKTPKSLRAACNIFTSLNVIMRQAGQDSEADLQPVGENDDHDITVESIPKEAIDNYIADIIIENDNKGKNTELGEVGSKLVNKYSDFDVRNYGYTLLSKFIEEVPSLYLRKHSGGYYVSLKDTQIAKATIEEFVTTLLKKQGSKGISLSNLANEIQRKYKSFNVKDYGYSTFLKFIQSMKNSEVKGLKNKTVYIKKQYHNDSEFS